MRLFHARAGNLDKFRLGAHIENSLTAGVAHSGTQTAHQLMDHRGHRTLNRDTAFDTLRHQLLNTALDGLEVAIAGTLHLCHGTERTHATVALVRTTLEQLNLTGRLIGTGKHTTGHNGGCPGNNRFGEVTGEADTAVGNQGNTIGFERFGDIGHGTDLRHANTGDDARGTDRARADTNLNAIGAGLSQRDCSGTGGNIAANHIDLRKGLLDPTDAIDHALAVAVGGVDNNHIDPGIDQRFDPIGGVGAGTDRRANAQATVFVFTGIGIGASLVDVFHRHHAGELKVLIDHQNLFDAMDMQQVTHLVLTLTFKHGNQLIFAGHDGGNAGIKVALEAHIAAGDDTDQVIAVEHRNAGNIVFRGQVDQFAYRGAESDGNGVTNHTGLVFLHQADVMGLLFDGHILMNNADTAFLRHRNRQTGFGDCIHCGRDQGDIEFDITGQASF